MEFEQQGVVLHTCWLLLTNVLENFSLIDTLWSGFNNIVKDALFLGLFSIKINKNLDITLPYKLGHASGYKSTAYLFIFMLQLFKLILVLPVFLLLSFASMHSVWSSTSLGPIACQWCHIKDFSTQVLCSYKFFLKSMIDIFTQYTLGKTCPHV